MSLDELEAAYRKRLSLASEPVVLICMQIPERDIRTLRPCLLREGKSLSDLVRRLLMTEAHSMAVAAALDAYNAQAAA